LHLIVRGGKPSAISGACICELTSPRAD